ncbi:MAG: hypothetical protein J5824_04665 [Lachnospiraceae bacterium]|nr:hypothetical protein [Lachnospiraceae bacterium]
MKISQKHIQYILLLLIVVIAVCAYQFGYVKYIEKANAVKEENKQIEARINELNSKEANRETWNQQIEQSEKDIKTILSKYGPGNTPQKSIMLVRSLEDTSGMQVGTIAFNPDTPLFISNDLDENGNPKVELDATSIAISYNTTYEGLKAAMDFITSYRERMNVESFSTNFNQENGQLAGNMIINLYGVKDANHVYTEPVVGGIEIGTDNIFGTVDLNAIIDALTGEIINGEGGEGEGGAPEGGNGEGAGETP